MHPLEKKVDQFLDKKRLALPGQRLLVAVSGGADSVALLYLLAALAERRQLAGLLAVYVDHGLRPTEVAAEKQLVAEHCQQLALPFFCRQVEVKARGESLEAVARCQRYQALAQVATAQQADAIAVAHTADDQAEELLLRLLRGSGRSGLSGMRSSRHGQVIRPLLETAKEELVTYLRRYHISWCEDSSNQDLRFVRNQIRLQLLPELSKYNPNIKRSLQGTARLLQDEEELLATLVADTVELLQSSNEGEEISLSLGPFLQLHVALQRRLVEEVFIRLRVRPSQEKIEQVLTLAAHGPGNSQLHFSQGLRLFKKDGQLSFFFPAGRGSGRGNL